MKLKIHRAHDGELDRYKEVLNKYNAEYYENNYRDSYALIKLESIAELLSLTSDLRRDIILDYENGSLMIYDDYLE